jgi:hypothetical protein
MIRKIKKFIFIPFVSCFTSLGLLDESISLDDSVGLATISVWVLFLVVEQVGMLLARRPEFDLLKTG